MNPSFRAFAPGSTLSELWVLSFTIQPETANVRPGINVIATQGATMPLPSGGRDDGT